MLSQKFIEFKWIDIKNGLKTLWGNLTDDEIESVRNDLYAIIPIVLSKNQVTRIDVVHCLEKLEASFQNPTDLGIDPDVSSYHRSPN